MSGYEQAKGVEEAALIAKKTTSLVETAGFYEHYNGETGTGHGVHDFTWGGLILALR